MDAFLLQSDQSGLSHAVTKHMFIKTIFLKQTSDFGTFSNYGLSQSDNFRARQVLKDESMAVFQDSPIK
jgi:hypothetical protein